jgi:hypothetical protein
VLNKVHKKSPKNPPLNIEAGRSSQRLSPPPITDNNGGDWHLGKNGLFMPKKIFARDL